MLHTFDSCTMLREIVEMTYESNRTNMSNSSSCSMATVPWDCIIFFPVSSENAGHTNVIFTLNQTWENGNEKCLLQGQRAHSKQIKTAPDSHKRS